MAAMVRSPAANDLEKRRSGVWRRDVDLEAATNGKTKKQYTLWTLLLAYQTLGVVYGDVGTSPLYVFASIFTDGPPSERNIIGAASLIIWSITCLVAGKYCLIVLRADDHGQGGTFALYAQLRRQGTRNAREALSEDGRATTADWRQRLIQSKHMQSTIRVLVMLGVGAIMGDGVLTPAISVVSACEGISISATSVTRNTIVGIASAILVLLFLFQRLGTSIVGYAFSPIASLWFLVNFVIGWYNIGKYNTSVFKAISPHYGIRYLVENGKTGWESLAGVLLCFTGTEALFADLGHFNRHAIQIGFFCVVYPSLMITYLGQAAYLTAHPENVSETYFKALPGWTYWPVFVIAIATAIIASQALISASFQIVKQAISQSFFPRFKVKHTSRKHAGQIYINFINFLLLALTLVVVIAFKSSARIGRAYGIAVICDMLLTTHFLTLLMITVWRKSLIFPAMFYVFFGAIEVLYVSSALRKVPSGGWFTLTMAAVYACVMMLWWQGSSRKARFFESTRRQLGDLLRIHRPSSDSVAVKSDKALARARGKLELTQSGMHVRRTPGLGIFFDSSIYGVPHTLTELVTRLPMLPELVVFLTNRFVPIPSVTDSERFLIEQQGLPGFFHIVARYGYNDTPVQDAAFVQDMLKCIMSRLGRSLRVTMVESEILKAQAEGSLSKDAAAIVDASGGTLYGKTYNSLLNADSSDPLSVSMTGIDTEMRRRQTRRPTILSADGAIRWPTMGDIEPDDSAAPAARLHALTFPQEMARFADKVARIVDKEGGGEVPPLVAHAGELAGDLALVAAASQHTAVVYVLGRSRLLTSKLSWKPHALAKLLLLEYPFELFVTNTGEPANSSFGVPTDKLLEVGLLYSI